MFGETITVEPMVPAVPSRTKEAVLQASRPRRTRKHILPGFGLTLGFTLFYLSAMVVLPLLALVLKAVLADGRLPELL